MSTLTPHCPARLAPGNRNSVRCVVGTPNQWESQLIFFFSQGGSLCRKTLRVFARTLFSIFTDYVLYSLNNIFSYFERLEQGTKIGRLTRVRNERSRQRIVFETSGRIDHDAPRRSDHHLHDPSAARTPIQKFTHPPLPEPFACNRTITTTKLTIRNHNAPVQRKVNETQVSHANSTHPHATHGPEGHAEEKRKRCV